MSNTVSLQATIGWTDNIQGSVSATGSKSVTQVGAAASLVVQVVGTTTEQLVFPADSVTPGYLFLKNLDATNYVEFDLNTPVAGTAFAKLKAGEFLLLPTTQTTIYGKANTGACNVQICVMPL